jgi:outer membrane beta-barrel protein
MPEVPMRASLRTILLVLMVTPLLVSAQQQLPGLDLSTPPPPRPTPPPAEKPPAARPAREAGTPLERAVGVPGEGEAALEDRVKAVQRKGFLKRDRLQLTAFVAPSVNDAFFQKLGLGGQVAWGFHDSFALALRGTYWLPFKTQYVRQGAIAFQSQLLSSQPDFSAMLDGVWSPVYGKFAWLGNRIVRFDAFLQAGAGLVWSATSGAPRNEGPHPAADLGAGIRFYPGDWLSLDLSVLGTFYADQKDQGLPGTIQKLVTITLGVSFFLPTRFEYEHP